MIIKGRGGLWVASSTVGPFPLSCSQWDICMFPPRTMDLLAGQDFQVTAYPGTSRRRLDDVVHEPWGIEEKEITVWVVIYPATLSSTGRQCGQRLTWRRDASLQTLLGPLRRLCSAGLLNLWHRSKARQGNVTSPFLP